MHVRKSSPPDARPSPSLAARGRSALLAALPAILAGAVAGWLVPRGPVTTAGAVVTVVGAVAVGALAGWWLASRWALLLAPVTFVLAFEVARMRVDGPTVDGIRLTDAYGLIALVIGRGVDTLLILFPMVVGATYGAALARRREPARPRGRLLLARRVGLVVASVAVLALVAGLLRPASTEPIVDADGDRVPGSIAELVEVPVNGHDQTVMLRGVSADAPVLLFLEGGPGGSAVGRIRGAGEDLEQSFVVATWEQRGTGKSYDALEPTSTMTLDQMVEDTLEVTDYLRERFDEEKIYLVGSSWGTVLGTLAARRAPERFHAYVGTGQMVDPFETDQRMYRTSIEDAEARGDDGQASLLREMGPPPYQDSLDYLAAIASNPTWSTFEHGEDYDPAAEYPASFFVAEYTLIEQLRGMAAIAETYAVLYPQLSGTDFRTGVPRLDVPVYVVEGEHEAEGREDLAADWFADLEAPSKDYVVFDRSGHTPPYDEPGRFAAFMRDVRDATEAQR